MQAVICTTYGPPEILQFQDVPPPKPADNEILVRVHAITVHAGDVRIRSFNVPGPL
jgi:NADPH:quinone reductase-like Zn-dependent oxidoreductase